MMMMMMIMTTVDSGDHFNITFDNAIPGLSLAQRPRDISYLAIHARQMVAVSDRLYGFYTLSCKMNQRDQSRGNKTTVS